MNTTTLKRKIEKQAMVFVTTDSYKRGKDPAEGYAYAYPRIAAMVRVGGRYKYKGNVVSQGESFGGRTRAQAVYNALLHLASRLNVVLTEEDETAVQRANDAEFEVRTRY